MTLGKRRIILFFCILAFLIMVPLVLFYASGYRLDSSFHLIKTGGLYISSPVSGSQIFINNEMEKETNILQSGIFSSSLKPGKYSILVAKEKYWPWFKELEVKEQFVTEARAFLMPKEPEGKVLLKKDITPSEVLKYDEITAKLKTIATNPSAKIDILSNHDRQKLWREENTNKIWVEWLGAETERPYYMNSNMVAVLNSKFPVKNASFYPGRYDVVIVAAQNGIFAIEIDGRGERIFQPIYKGKNPIFTTYKKERAIYILDENMLIKINL